MTSPRPPRRCFFQTILALAALGLVAGIIGCSLGEPPVTVYHGGPILTLDSTDRVVEALGVRGERIEALGTLQEVRAWGGADAREVDLQGAALLPGFIDAHGHFPGEGVYAEVVDVNSPPIGTVERMEQLVERLRKKAASTDPGEWVGGMGYDDTQLAEGRHPTREDLDRVSTEHPVAVLHISGHLAAVNSLALEQFGFGPETPDPPGGRIQRDADGNPNGVLEENAGEPAMAKVLQPGALGALAMLREAGRRYSAAGVTTAQSGYMAQELTPLLWASRLGVIPIRLVLWPGMEFADEILAGNAELESYDEDWVRIGAVKLIADGSIQG
jgi:predicted amidohydrolase YtcJ